MRHSEATSPQREHGHHTLEVLRGTVVGVHRHDVFVDLGPRRQGVIRRDAFEQPPEVGECYDFTLRGREEDLWVLALEAQHSLVSWERAEVGNLLSARVLREHGDGLQLKAGNLHAWMPRSQSGVPRGHKPKELVGRTVTVEVIEVDPRHQRVIVSRKTVLKREREQRQEAGPLPGDTVHGTVVRLEDYGAFVQFGRGRQGLVHLSNLSYEALDHPEQVLRLGDAVTARVLSVRQGGRKIALGLKQLQESPWRRLAATGFRGQLLEGEVVELVPFGAFVRVETGVRGLVPNSQGADARRLRDVLRIGQRLSVRVVDLDPEHERLTLSLVHVGGAAIRPGDAVGAGDLRDLAHELGAAGPGTNLGRLLRQALHKDAG